MVTGGEPPEGPNARDGENSRSLTAPDPHHVTSTFHRPDLGPPGARRSPENFIALLVQILQK